MNSRSAHSPRPQIPERAIDLALATLGKLKQDALGNEAIDSARNYLLGQYPLAFETPADWAIALGDLDLYGLPESYIGQFGTDLLKVDSAAHPHGRSTTAFPSPENLDIVLIGDAAHIGDVAAKLGPVTKMSLVRAAVRSAARRPLSLHPRRVLSGAGARSAAQRDATDFS